MIQGEIKQAKFQCYLNKRMKPINCAISVNVCQNHSRLCISKELTSFILST